MDNAETTSQPSSRSRRGVFLKWLRKMHGWIGLWGALLGLLFGITGILLNHRAVMKIPAAHSVESNVQLELPAPLPADEQALATWLQKELGVDRPASRIKKEPSRPAAWGDKTIRQPEKWTAAFVTPQVNLQTEYWVGNGYVSVKRSDNNIFATLNNFHKGTGLGVGWVLLADTLAGSIILLSLSGIVLWVMMNRRRTVGIAIGALSVAVSLAIALPSL
jgi:hypothetical protein